MPADAVDLVNQVPRPLVGHLHGAAGGRNRPAVADLLEQLDLAGPDPLVAIEIDANAQMWKRFGARF
jgi:hypothetical protein